MGTRYGETCNLRFRREEGQGRSMGGPPGGGEGHRQGHAEAVQVTQRPRHSYLGQLRIVADKVGNIIGNIRQSTEGYGVVHLDTTACCGRDGTTLFQIRQHAEGRGT